MTAGGGRHNRAKGHAAEREITHICWEFGFDEARRSGDAGQVDGDIVNVPPLYLSVKRTEKARFVEWAEEVEHAASGLQIPTLVWRRSGQPWRATLPFRDLLGLVVEARGLPKEPQK